jgi:tetratricopeptide (TPR) repeat protein
MNIHIRETCLFVVILASKCIAQYNPSVVSPEQLKAEWEKNPTKFADVPFNLLEECGPLIGVDPGCGQPRQPQQSSGSVVYAPHLRHKVPREARKSFYRALSLSHAGDHRAAEEELERAIGLDPYFAEAYCNLGIEYVSLGSYQVAEARFRQCIAADPASSDAYYNLSVLLMALGNSRDAEDTLRRSLELSPNNAKAHFLLGSLLLGVAGNRIEAMQHLKNAARTIPSARLVLKQYGSNAPR